MNLWLKTNIKSVSVCLLFIAKYLDVSFTYFIERTLKLKGKKVVDVVSKVAANVLYLYTKLLKETNELLYE